METQSIQIKLNELSEELKKEVLDYIDFLIAKYHKEEKKGKLKFDWGGWIIRYKRQVYIG